MSIISLACLFKLLYCSPVWRPQNIKGIRDLESVQRRTTKFILDDYSSDTKLHLTSLSDVVEKDGIGTGRVRSRDFGPVYVSGRNVDSAMTS